MNQSPAVDAARNFLDTVWAGEAPDDAALAAAIDALLSSYHQTPDAPPSDSTLEPPREDSLSLRKRIDARFPDYGYYPVADPVAEPGRAEMMTGDAINDLLDITLDMREVVWRAENISLEDAHWGFRLLYFHWGRHARELGLYLHARQFG